MSDETKSSSVLSRLGRALIQILRLIFLLAVIAIIGAAIYFGVPYINERVILPIETNTARLEEIENKQLSEREQLDDQVSNMQNSMNELENKQTENAQNLAEMQGQVDAFESAIDAHSETLKSLDAIEASLDTLLETVEKHEDLLIGGDSALETLERQLSLSRSIELLSRAQLHLSQSNFGLAKQDIENAIDLLLALETEMPKERAETLEPVLENLNLALDNLPEFPVIAVDSLNIAWQLLVNDLPELPDLLPVTETPEADIETPTPEIEPVPTESP